MYFRKNISSITWMAVVAPKNIRVDPIYNVLIGIGLN